MRAIFVKFLSNYFADFRKSITFVGSYMKRADTEGWVSGLNQQFAKLPIS